MFDGKPLLITGGTAVFDKKCVKTLLQRYQPKRVVVYSRDELKQYEMQPVYNDPCMGCFTTAISSVALGASIIEKHFTLDRDGDGPDDSFSLEPAELVALCRDAKTAWSALGRAGDDRKESERDNARFRRSLFVVRDVKAGDPVDDENVRSIRPEPDLAPVYLPVVQQMRLSRDVPRGSPLAWTQPIDP